MRRKAIELKVKGLTYAEIGAVLGVSGPYVHRMIKPPSFVYDAVKKRARNRCERCKQLLLDKAGAVHHKHTNTFENWNDIAQLEYLCQSCHMKEHMTKSLDNILKQTEWQRVERYVANGGSIRTSKRGKLS
jgi:hypothetical protein